MVWPLPCILMNSENSNSWIEEYLGEDLKLIDIGQNIKMNSYSAFMEEKIFLTFGVSSRTETDPAHNERN